MSISAPRDYAGSKKPKNNKGGAHVSPRTKDKRITPGRGLDHQLIEEKDPTYLTKSRERTRSIAELTMF